MRPKLNSSVWCESDYHYRYEYYPDFNEWIDSDDNLASQEKFKIDGLANPSKAFFAGDNEAYNQAFQEFRLQKPVPQPFFVSDISRSHHTPHWPEILVQKEQRALSSCADKA